MPSIVSTGGEDGVGVLKAGGSGSREVATDMKRSRIAQMTAARPPTTPTTLRIRFTMSKGTVCVGSRTLPNP